MKIRPLEPRGETEEMPSYWRSLDGLAKERLSGKLLSGFFSLRDRFFAEGWPWGEVDGELVAYIRSALIKRVIEHEERQAPVPDVSVPYEGDDSVFFYNTAKRGRE